MANIDLVFRVLGKDQTGAAMKSATKNLQGLGQAGDKASRSTDRMAGALDKAVKAGAGLAIAAGLMSVVNSASRVEQSTGAINAVFKDQASIMQAAAKDADRLGLSQAEYGEVSVRLASLLKNQGVAQDEVAARTQTLITLGADLSAMYGGTTANAVEALGAALRGEFEQAEMFGITIKESMVTAEMATAGVSRAQAVMNLVTKQSADAMGAAGREAGSFASKQQQMQASIENAKAAIGEGLLPVMSSLAGYAADVARVFAAVPAPVYAVAAAVGGLIVAKAGLSLAIARATAALTAYEVKTMTATRGTSMLGLAAGVASTKMATMMRGLGIATVALIGWDQASNKANDSLRQQVQTVDQITESLTEQGKSVQDLNIDLSNWAGATPLIDDQLESWKALEHVFNQSGWEKGKNVLGEIFSLGKGEGTVERTAAVQWLDNVKASIVEISSQDPTRARQLFDQLTEAMQQAGASSEDIARVQSELRPAMEQAGEGVAVQTNSMRALNDAQKAAKDSLSALNSAVAAMSDPFLQAQEAAAAWTSSLQAASQAVAENGATLDINTEAGRSNQAALIDATRAAQDHLSAMAANGATASELTAAQGAMGDALYTTAIQMGANEQQARNYANGVRNIPLSWLTTVAAETRNASFDVQSFTSLLSQIPRNIPVTIGVTRVGDQTFFGPGFGTVARANGGIVGYARGGMVPVSVSNGEYILSPGQVASMGIGGADALNRARVLPFGKVRGPGSGTSDSITGLLPEGSYVVRASSARMFTGSASNVLTSAQWSAMGSSGKDKTTNVDLYIDGRMLHESLVRYKRAMGGSPLGLS